MADVALTSITYTNPEDGVAVFVIADGDTSPQVPTGAKVVELKDLPKDVQKQLKEAGAIGEPVKPAAQVAEEQAALAGENEDLKAQVADLQAQLEAAKKPATSTAKS